VIRIVLADDHPLFIEALRYGLAGEFALVGLAHSLTDAVRTVVEQRPEVCLLDRHFHDGDGLAAIGPIREASPTTRVVVITGDPSAAASFAALEAGAHGFVHKTRGLAAITHVVRTVTRQPGGPPPVEVVVPQPRRPEPDPVQTLLTPRERDCLRLVADGLTTGAIARRLHLRPATVGGHVRSVLSKLGVHSRLEAALVAHRHGLACGE
jgi:two-component system nitrate/nitrite response regulator NarL